MATLCEEGGHEAEQHHTISECEDSTNTEFIFRNPIVTLGGGFTALLTPASTMSNEIG